ncbi:agmatinase, partial [Streptomyces virginiae]
MNGRGPHPSGDSSRIPRYAGPATFARLPRLDEVGSADV